MLIRIEIKKEKLEQNPCPTVAMEDNPQRRQETDKGLVWEAPLIGHSLLLAAYS